MNRVVTILISMLILGAFLRIYNIESVPVSLNRDEVGFGYDAYSLFKTGRDQYGQWLPLMLRSSDDYKLAVYAYSAAPFFLTFGQSNTAVRLSSSFAGIITIVVVYFLVKKITVFMKNSSVQSANKIALLASFIMTVSPWHIQYSRTAFEGNLGLLLLSTGLTVFLLSYNSYVFSFLSGLFLGISMFTYHSYRFVAPILLCVCFYIYFKRIPTKKMFVTGGIVVFFILITIPTIISRPARIRYEVINLFTTDSSENDLYRKESAEKINQDHLRNFDITGIIVHNRRIATIKYETIRSYLYNVYLHLSPDFLLTGKFVGSTHERSHSPSYGLVHSWEFIFLIIGSLVIVLRRVNRFNSLFVFWLIAGLAQAAASWNSPNSWRVLVIVLPITWLTALGISTTLSFVKKESQNMGTIFSLILTFFVTITVFVYLHYYHIHLNYERSEDWHYGRREAALFANEVRTKYHKIIVSPSLDDPHLYFLFYLRYDPLRYLEEGGTVSGGWTATQNKFSSYEFKPINFDLSTYEPGYLFIGLPHEFPSDAKILKIIYYLSGKEAIKIVET